METFAEKFVTVIDENFLCEEEIQEVLDSIALLEPEYSSPLYPEYPDKCTMLPRGCYTKKYTPDEYRSEVKRCRNVMLEHFSWLYAKMIPEMNKHYDKPCKFVPTLNTPGFHLMHGPCSNEHQIEGYAVGADGGYFFHKDYFTWMEELKEFEIDSWILVIQVPKFPTGLVFRDDSRLNYKAGMFARWQGNISHAISDVICEEGEARITLQSHVALREGHDSNIIFW